MSGRHLAFPFRIGADGRTQQPLDADDAKTLVRLLSKIC